MDLTLTVTCEVEGRSRSYDLEFQKDEIRIGRRSSSDVQLPGMEVSGEHARILVEGDRLFVEDLESSNGTKVAGRRISARERVPLELGSELGIVGYRIRVSRPAQELDDLTAEKTDMVAMKMVREVLASFGAERKPPRLEVVNDAEKGTRLELDVDEGEYRIGREKGCDLRLRHWSISRRHALVRKSFDVVTVVDLDSKNGVTVNGERLTGSRVLADGDVVGVGHTEVEYRRPAGGRAESQRESRSPPGSLKDIGLDVEALVSGRRAEKETPAERTRGISEDEPAATGPGPGPALRPPPPEPSLADYLPLIVGIALAIGAVLAALFVFVL